MFFLVKAALGGSATNETNLSKLIGDAGYMRYMKEPSIVTGYNVTI